MSAATSRSTPTSPSANTWRAARRKPAVNHMDSYVVAYDICDPKRLRKVAQTCEDFGLRRQYSVFFCRLTAADFVRLKS